MVVLLASCDRDNALEQIRQSGKVTVLTRNNAHCYYTYRDKPMGFEYDLATLFSKRLQVELQVVTPGWGELYDAVKDQKGDFIAASMTITESREEEVDFSDAYLEVQQMVVVHRDNHQIKALENLNGKIIHVRKGTSYEERLTELKNEGLDISIELHDDIPSEELIRMVAEKEVQITVADSNIALLNRRYYPDVRIAFPIEEPQSLGWVVKKGNTALLGEINDFLRDITASGDLSKAYQKHYGDVEIFDYVDLRKFHRRIETRLPKYEAMIRKASEKNGFDWRLIAAVIYQESHFNPRARSHTGVRGIMQLTLPTAREMGIRDRLNPEQSIRGGVRYLKKLYDKYDDIEDPDRMWITLASYNVGRGHVLDARGIAEEAGLDPDKWSDLAQTLPLLRFRKHYQKTSYGYCRGTEPVRYVNRVLTYYDILKRKSPG